MSWVAALACALLAQEPAPPAAPAVQPTRSAAATIAEWRELLVIDLPAAVLSEGPARVAAGGDLADRGEAIALVARALFENGRGTEADALLESAQPTPETLGYVELERARLWIEDDELERALEFLMPGPDPEALRAGDLPEAWLLAGRAWARRGEPARARPLLERFVTLAPFHAETPAALHMLAQQAVREGDGPRAASLSRRAQEVGRWRSFLRVRLIQAREQPDEPLPRLGLAQLWLQTGDLDRAEAELARVFALDPDHASGWFHQGEIHRMRGDLPAAAKAFDRALAGDPELFVARHNRAVIALRAGELSDARRDLEILVSGEHGSDPRVVSAHLLLARILLESGEPMAAAERYETYQQLGGREPLRP